MKEVEVKEVKPTPIYEIVKETAEKLGVDPGPSSFMAFIGASPDSITRVMGSQLNVKLTREAEEAAPKPKKVKGYTKIEKLIADMLTENTGAHFLDSGGAYGRSWQRNREITDFRETPPITVELYGKPGDHVDEIGFSLNVFHYLTDYLDTDDNTKRYNRMLTNILKDPDEGYYSSMETLAEKLKELGEIEAYNSFNTYNYDSSLSQILQGVYMNTGYGETYLILQIHGGCDARGGYTKPRVFYVNDFDYMCMADGDFIASCDCMGLYTDDHGYHWYNNNDGEDGIPETWKIADTKPLTLVCETCKKTVSFGNGEHEAIYV